MMRLVITPPCLLRFGKLAVEPVKVYHPAEQGVSASLQPFPVPVLARGSVCGYPMLQSDSPSAGASGFRRGSGRFRQSHQPEYQGVKHSIGQKALDCQSQTRMTGSRVARSGTPRR